MSDITDVRYVRFGTRNLPAAIDFATRIVGLELVRQEHGSAYFRSDDRDHTLCYFEGDPGRCGTGAGWLAGAVWNARRV